MSNRTSKPVHLLVKDQGALALLCATIEFLRRNNVSKKTIKSFKLPHRPSRKDNADSRLYRKLMRAYEDMGVLMTTWFSNPKFLDKTGQPVALTLRSGPHSVATLIKLSRIRVSRHLALELMRYSPSIRSNADGTLAAVRRVFVLPEFEVPRAALVMERYLDTLRRNASGRKSRAALLLERSCHVPEIDLRTIAPVLRDIKQRGSAFMDLVDGEIEGCRAPRSSRRAAGELGVVVFAWTRPNQIASRLQKSSIRVQASSRRMRAQQNAPSVS
jgi:hypothetical protein